MGSEERLRQINLQALLKIGSLVLNGQSTLLEIPAGDGFVFVEHKTILASMFSEPKVRK